MLRENHVVFSDSIMARLCKNPNDLITILAIRSTAHWGGLEGNGKENTTHDMNKQPAVWKKKKKKEILRPSTQTIDVVNRIVYL